MYSVLFATAIALSSVLTPFVTASPVLSTRGLDYNWNDLRPNSMLMFQDMSCEDIKNMGAPALMHNTDVSVIEQEPQMKKAITELLIWHETNSHGKWTYVGLDLDDKPLTFDFLYYQNYKIKTILFTFDELKYNFKAYRKNDNAEYWLVVCSLRPIECTEFSCDPVGLRARADVERRRERYFPAGGRRKGIRSEDVVQGRRPGLLLQPVRAHFQRRRLHGLRQEGNALQCPDHEEEVLSF